MNARDATGSTPLMVAAHEAPRIRPCFYRKAVPPRPPAISRCQPAPRACRLAAVPCANFPATRRCTKRRAPARPSDNLLVEAGGAPIDWSYATPLMHAAGRAEASTAVDVLIEAGANGGGRRHRRSAALRRAAEAAAIRRSLPAVPTVAPLTRGSPP